MNLKKWTFIRFDDLLGKDFEQFLSKLINKKINYLLYLKVENTPKCLTITGYSVQSSSNTDLTVLGDYIFSSIDRFIFEQYKNNILNDKKGKDVLYILSFRKYMFTYKK